MAHYRYPPSSPLSMQFIFQNLTLNAQTKEQNRTYTLFLRYVFTHNYQLIWDPKFQDACVNFPSQFSNDELLHCLATSDNCHPVFYILRDFPVFHFNYLTYDNLSTDKSLELPSPSSLRPYATIRNPPPNLDHPPPPSLNDPITTQPSSSHSPHQYNTPSNSPPRKTITIQPNLSKTQQPLPPIPISCPNVTNVTQRQAHSSQTYLSTSLSTNLHSPLSFPLPRITSSTSYDPYATLHHGFHNCPPSSPASYFASYPSLTI